MHTICIIVIVLLTELCVIFSACPPLKPNPNVAVTCFVGEGLNKKHMDCLRDGNITEIAVGTIVRYKCNQYFKSVTREHNNGSLNCASTGKWTNQRLFQNFHCEVDCGKQPKLKTELIRDGNSTQAKNWPWVATIFRQTRQGHFKYSCGGTLIGQKTILTAAHCLVDSQRNKLSTNIFKIFLSTLSGSFDENVKNSVQSYLVKEFHVHPDYRIETFEVDVAIIVLAEPVNLTASALPICLPTSYQHDELALRSGNTGEIASFGIDGTGLPAKVLQHATIPVLSSANCNDVINILPQGDQFCGGNPKGPNICRGDSGSGLVFKLVEWNEEKYYMHGLVSNTGELANGCAPMVIFTKVFSYINWIQEMLVEVEDSGYLRNIQLSTSKVKQGTMTRPEHKLYTRAERTTLTKVRVLVKDILLEEYMHKDEYLIRFLRTKKLNLAMTEQMLQNTMDWRKANHMNKILTEDFTEMRKFLPIFFQGYDKDGRPVFIYWFGDWTDTKLVKPGEVEKHVRYMSRNAEISEERIRSTGGGNITQSIMIIDFHGVTINHLCPLCLRTLGMSVQIYEKYYPQQVHLWYSINVSALGDIAFDAILPFLSEYASTTIHVFGTNKTEWSQALLKQIPADQLFITYGGTKYIKKETKRLELAL